MGGGFAGDRVARVEVRMIEAVVNGVEVLVMVVLGLVGLGLLALIAVLGVAAKCSCGSAAKIAHRRQVAGLDVEMEVYCETCSPVAFMVNHKDVDPRNSEIGNLEITGVVGAEPMTLCPNCLAAIDLAVQYGGNDGAMHKDWVIDQMVRVLAGDDYPKIVANAKAGEDGPDTYEWNTGIAP